MTSQWQKELSCATACARCNTQMKPTDKRILSVYDHQAICMKCKKKETRRPDYEKVSISMVGNCMIETEVQYGDPGGYCFYHFHPFTCS